MNNRGKIRKEEVGLGFAQVDLRVVESLDTDTSEGSTKKWEGYKKSLNKSDAGVRIGPKIEYSPWQTW